VLDGERHRRTQNKALTRALMASMEGERKRVYEAMKGGRSNQRGRENASP